MPRSCEAAHEDSKVEAQEREKVITLLLITDPWSKGDYSRHIREASMAMDGLPEGVSPSGRVLEQLLQAAPILKRRRRNTKGFAKKGSVLGVSTPRGKYRRRGCRGDPRGKQEGAPRGPGWGRATSPPGCLVVAPLPFLMTLEGSVTLIFNIIFRELFGHFKFGKPEKQKQ